jgi:hypothetical protein
LAAQAFWNSVVIAREVAGEKPAGDVQKSSCARIHGSS